MSNSPQRSNIGALALGGAVALTALSACERAQTTVPPEAPVALTQAEANAPTAEKPVAETTLTLRFSGDKAPTYASVKPARMNDRITKDWHPLDGHTFELEGPEAYEMKLVFDKDSKASEGDRVFFVVDEPGPITLRFEEGRVVHGEYEWGTVWPSMNTLSDSVKEAGLWSAWKTYIDRPALVHVLDPRNSSSKTQRAQLRRATEEMHDRWKREIQAMNDPLLRQIATVHYLELFSAIATPGPDRGIPRPAAFCSDCNPLMAQLLDPNAAAHEALLPADELAWVFEDVPLDHPVWGAKSGVLLTPLLLLGERRMGDRVDQIAANTTFDGLRVTLRSARDTWIAHRGEAIVHDGVDEQPSNDG